MNPIVELSLVLIYLTSHVVIAQDKRLLLHNDQDLYQVISSLQTEMAALNSSLRAETTLTSSLRNEMMSLNSSLHTEVATLTSKLQKEETRTSSLEAKIATLNSSLQNEVSSRQTEVAALESKITALEAQQTVGSTYVHWGRTSCPGNGTEMVYKGRMAGSKWDETGGGANHVCLPDDPTWGKYVDGMTGWATIYGTEIELPDNVANILFGKNVQNQDIPCALCMTARPTNAMIPGREACYPGWTLEYQGYLVATKHTNPTNGDYVCLDAGLEFAPHGAADDNEHIIEIVEAVCGKSGSLSCPPYVNGR